MEEADEDKKNNFGKYIMNQMKRPESPKFGKDEEKSPENETEENNSQINDTVFELLDKEKFLDFLRNRKIA
jgi:hypothetical protein